MLLPQFSYATFHSTTGNITYTLKGSLDNTREPVRAKRSRERDIEKGPLTHHLVSTTLQRP